MVLNIIQKKAYFSKAMFVLCCLMITVVTLNAQSDRQLWKEAEQSLMVHDYRNARINYNMLLDKDENNANYAFKIGYCYLHDEEIDGVETAIKYLEKAAENISNNYNDNFRESQAPPETEYFLGVAYRLLSHHDEALSHFKKYKSYDSYNIEGVNKKLIDREISSCEFMINNPPEEFQVEKFNFDVDVPEGLHLKCPVVSGNDSVFVYTIGDQNIYPPDININRDLYSFPVDDIYFSTWTNDGWTSPQNISDDLGVNGFAMPTSISYDGTKLLLVKDDGDDGNIYMSEFKDGQWQKAEKLNKNINTNKWESHAVMNKDETRLYFTSARRGGSGDLDLYLSERNNLGQWGEPKNLGDVFNTEMHEETPFLLEKENQLYFGSEKHDNMGGFDMFVSIYDSIRNKWRDPINLGYPYNTGGNDLAYIVSFHDLFIYCPQNSNIRREGISGSDCFSLRMPPKEQLVTLKGRIYIPELNNEIPVDLKIAAIDNETGDTISIHSAEEDGSFVIKNLYADDITLVAMSSKRIQNQIIEVKVPEGFTEIEYPIDVYLNASELALKEMEEEELAMKQEAEDTTQVVEEETEEIALHEEIEVEKEVQVEKDTTQFIEEEGEEIALHEEIEEEEVQTDTTEEKGTAQKELVIEPVFFDFDQSNIKSQYEENLNKLADFMKKKPRFEIEIHGHTDHIGTETYNIGLGHKRADAIRKYLTENGVKKDNIITKSFGEYRPVAKPLATNEARKFNRRAEFKFPDEYDNISFASVTVPERFRVFSTDPNDSSGFNSGSLTELSGKYLIIGGSFMFSQNAINAASSYEEMGYTCSILPANNGFNRVAIKAFDTKEDARQQLPDLRQATSVEGLWILNP